MYATNPKSDPKYIPRLKSSLEARESGQTTLDEKMRDLFLQRHVIEGRKPESPDIQFKPVGTGYAGLMIDKNGTDEIPSQRRVWQPGEHFSMQQSAAKYTGFGRRRPRYTTCFVVNEDGLPEWSCGGVRPRPEMLTPWRIQASAFSPAARVPCSPPAMSSTQLLNCWCTSGP